MRLPGLRILAALGFVALALAACGTQSTNATKLAGGTATFAEGPNAKPNYIFPLTSGAYFSVTNLSQFQFLIYRPLYWFGDNGQVKLNSS
jgi:peptide/nickel transport system substrate-binding protein